MKKQFYCFMLLPLIFIFLLATSMAALAGWTTITTGTSQSLWGIWGSSASDVYVGGDSNTLLHFDGSTWSTVNIGITTVDIENIWGSSASDVYVVGANGTFHYDGSSWTAVNTGASLVYGLWGTSASNIYTSDAYGNIYHYNGSSWTTAYTAATSSTIWDIWGSSASDVFAVGNSGAIYHYNGNAWSPMTVSTTENLFDVWGASASDVYAVGVNGTVFHYNGSSWSKESVGSSVSFYGVWASSASDVYVAGNGNTILHYDGSTWASLSPPGFTSFYEIWGSSATDIYFCGAGGTILHYDGIPTSSTTTILSTTTTSTTAPLTSTTTSLPAGNTPPTALFKINSTSGEPETEFVFDATDCNDAEDPSEALEVRWDWDGGGMWDTGWDTEKIATHQYEAEGTYTVILEVKDTGGLTDTASQQVKVISAGDLAEENIPPNAIFFVEPVEGTTLTEFNVDASESHDPDNPDGFLELHWDWEGDGMWDTDLTTQKTAVHQYDEPGMYIITLEVIDSGGLTDIETHEVIVEGIGDEGDGDGSEAGSDEGENTPPKAVVHVHPPEGDTNTEFEFMAHESTDIEDHPDELIVRWDFESDENWDTDYSPEKVIYHRYEVPGHYMTTLEVKDTGGLTDRATTEVMVGEPECAIGTMLGKSDSETLKRFQDKVLSKTKAGKVLIQLYYKNNKRISEYLDKHPGFRSRLEKVLTALIPVIKQHIDLQ
jgi:PKD repeat protein